MEKVQKYSLKREPSDIPAETITSSKDAWEYIERFYGDDLDVYESFFLIMLDRANRTIGWVKISQGGVSGTVVDPRIIAKYTIDSLCSSVILSHNHPAGNLTPSPADKAITTKIREGLGLFDIKVLDHIIISRIGYFSFQEEGLL